MNYDYVKIGKRIKSERQAAGFRTQQEFADKMKVRRSTIGSWENGSTVPPLQKMLDMCKYFNCEMGYLLCEVGYDNKTRTTTDICKITGLSGEAVDTLSTHKDSTVSELLNMISINSDNIIDVIYSFLECKNEEEQLKKLPCFHIVEKAYRQAAKETKNGYFYFQNDSKEHYKKFMEIIMNRYRKQFDSQEEKDKRKYMNRVLLDTDLLYEELTLKELELYSNNFDFWKELESRLSAIFERLNRLEAADEAKFIAALKFVKILEKLEY